MFTLLRFPAARASRLSSFARRWRRPLFAAAMAVGSLGVLVGLRVGGDVGDVMAVAGVVVAFFSVYRYLR